VVRLIDPPLIELNQSSETIVVMLLKISNKLDFQNVLCLWLKPWLVEKDLVLWVRHHGLC